MSWIDPAFTLGVMGQERDRVLALLATEGLIGANAAAPMPDVALHIALVTSIGSAAHADALDELRRAGVGFRITAIDARTQGADAARSIVAALRSAVERSAEIVLLVRGGGARTDLAAFDTESVARAIAASPVPVVTGIGHEIDRTVADEIAHSAHKTPTAAAVAVADGARRAARDMEVAAAQLPAAVRGALVRAARTLDGAAHGAGRSAGLQLEITRREVEHLSRRVGSAAPRVLALDSTRLADAAVRIGPSVQRRLDGDRERLDGLAARSHAHDPAAAMARGWSITRGADGRALRSVDGLTPGDVIRTTLADGTVHASVVAVGDESSQEHP